MAKTDYEIYIRTDELLALQKPADKRVHADELLFQTIHQTFELWFKDALSETEQIALALKDGRLLRAGQLLLRIRLILGVLTEQLAVLETMNPKDYHVIRLALGRGSGQDSPGFNAMLRIGEPLWDAFEEVRKDRGVSLFDLHRNPDAQPDLFHVMESMMDVDERFVRWRFCHFQLVRRMIGENVKSLKGIPAAQLALGMREYLFPQLWAVINDVTLDAKPTY